MADSYELRDHIREVLRERGLNSAGLWDDFTAGSLAAAFNHLVPAGLALSAEGGVSLEVRSHLAGRLPAHRQAQIEKGIARAIACVGAAIAEPSSDIGRVTESLMTQSLVYSRSLPTGALSFVPHLARTLPGFVDASIPERAIVRLANVLPAVGDAGDPFRLLALRQPEVRAVREVVDVAKTAGLTVSLKGVVESVESVVTSSQAEDLDDLLSDLTEKVVPMPGLVGRLDGMRFSRQLFYFESANGRELSGLVDEALLARTQSLLDQPVEVDLEQVTKIKRDGSRQRPTYRLVDVRPGPREEGLEELDGWT